jgi:glycosyltransferase involved in cell wall biosynthesis
MKIVLLTHPQFLSSQSMPRFAQMIADGMRTRGHNLEIWTPQPILFRIPVNSKLRKWLGYIDQYVLFPLVVRFRLLLASHDTVFVFADQALGPWVPLVAHRPHVVHVHDFLALRSALGEIPKNPTGWTGRQYQAMIRRGFSKGQNFISVSANTKRELGRFLQAQPQRSEVAFNGLNYPFVPMPVVDADEVLKQAGIHMSAQGFLVHVGGNQWYKNRTGVLEIYAAYAKQTPAPLPLLMIGELPTESLRALAEQVAGHGAVRFVSGLSNETVCAAYSLARLMVFPSLAEGFGWPIAEAMACGCPVLTTAEAPMTEVGGNAAHYLPKRPSGDVAEWAAKGAIKIISILASPADASAARRESGLAHVKQFDSELAFSRYEAIYQQVLAEAQE